MRRVSPTETAHPYFDPGTPLLAFAHRGGAHHPDIAGLENSLAAFAHAVSLGYHHLETDVHVTADGVLFAFHDDHLDRVTDGTGAVSELTADQVRSARIAGREPVPTFAELLDAFPGERINVDVKSDGTVEPLVALLEERDAWDRVLVGSFSRRRLSRYRRLAGGRGVTSAHPLEVVAYRFLPTARLARLLTPGRPAALQVPHRRGRVTLVTPGLVARAHANGLFVHVWTIDDPDEMEQLIDRGVDGLMTDRTDRLKQTLVRRGLWKEPS